MVLFLLLHRELRHDRWSGLLFALCSCPTLESTRRRSSVSPLRVFARDARDIFLGVTAAVEGDAKAQPCLVPRGLTGIAHIHDGMMGGWYSVTCTLRPHGHSSAVACAVLRLQSRSQQVQCMIKPPTVHRAGNGTQMEKCPCYIAHYFMTIRM